MLENPRSPRARAVAKLAKRAARDETGLYLLEGPQAVREALAFRADGLVELYATPAAWDRHADLREAASRAGLRVELASDAVIEAMADTVTPQGIIAVARQDEASIDDVLARAPRLLAICEEIRDPGNLGTIIRAADAVGADAVVLTGRTVDPYNPKVVRSTTGSLFHVPVARVESLEDVIDAARAAGLRVVAADVKGDDLLDARRAGELDGPTAWVFGNEAHGLPDEALEWVDAALRLPIYGQAESLNLATAASVCLYESAFAQRG
ncbi:MULTISPECIES: TrmH family RNA methyltransferase [Microbacterium]|uniref:23S rRNA (Uridine(2479)-2'-O)-methyltransferase n=4 Tax=Bacteria TaxID=2 RepID=A0A0F0LVN0_9MICO|nr:MULTISPECIES: RNA methyltransferase [Microbacterium]MCK9916596.1 RNA methyltransferase [Microbacteriaceae bacterium K1510]KJL36360.1 23S rRNA (uridine(2479)-2'-O)-methyltransferase [Microbacterium ginsengisoli]KQR92265.1 RNA methyltransferase [Microbacterium sp. Leaf351]KQR92785.1 RNA methyltransferase [Microbacterium sp. Leaf347]MBN9198983.1 RNA methyltransferase [Microbacterium ginsengisoli]